MGKKSHRSCLEFFGICLLELEEKKRKKREDVSPRAIEPTVCQLRLNYSRQKEQKKRDEGERECVCVREKEGERERERERE